MKYSKTILTAVIACLAIYFSFYTENLTERRNRELKDQYSPEQLVSITLNDSLQSLEQKAVSISMLAEGIKANAEDFATKHGKVLGIGSPIFYVVKGECVNAKLIDNEEIHATVGGVSITIPVKYIFGNNLRDASGWFDIDDFKNTMDFNAVSAELNKHVSKKLAEFKMPAENDTLKFLGAAAITPHSSDISSLTIIPYTLK